MVFDVFDLETNGVINKSKGFMPQPQQCARIRLDQDFNFVESECLYFYNEALIEHSDTAEKGAPATPWRAAFEGHGLSREFLSQYADSFDDNIRRMYRFAYRGNLVGHNIRDFDIPIMQDFMKKVNYGNTPVNKTFDTMWLLQPIWKVVNPDKKSGKAKLSEACEYFSVDEETIAMFYEMWWGEEPTKLWHGAKWDTTANALLFINLVNEGAVRGFK